MWIKTSKGGEFESDLVFEVDMDHTLLIRLTEEKRPLSAVAADFEDSGTITCEDGRVFEGYAELFSVVRFGERDLQVRIKKGTESGS